MTFCGASCNPERYVRYAIIVVGIARPMGTAIAIISAGARPEEPCDDDVDDVSNDGAGAVANAPITSVCAPRTDHTNWSGAGAGGSSS